MLNMIDTQDKLKNFSEQQLIQEMQQPSGSAPQFMVLGEIERRKRMRADTQKQQGLMQPTVAQEAVSAAGVPQQGIAQVAKSLAPKTDMTQNTGVPNAQAASLPAQPNQPQRMADGGVVRMAEAGRLSGGTISAIANLKVMRPDLYEEYKNDPEMLEILAAGFQNVAKDSEMTGLEAVSAPRENDLIKRMFRDPTRGDIIDQQKKDAREFGEDYVLDQRAQSLVNQRKAAAFGDDMLFDDPTSPEGKAREYLGGSVVPMPGPDQPFTEGLASLAAPERLADPVLSATIDGDPRAVDDASDFSNNPRRGAARPPAIPGMNDDVLPETSIANARADADRDDLLRYLRGEGEMSFVEGVVDEAAGEDGSRRLTTQNLRDPSMSMRNPIGELMFGDEPGSSPRQDLNRRAYEYMQRDKYTPPEQIYDLGPKGRLKYEEAGDDEFTSVSNRLAREAAADARTKEDAFFAAENARFDAQRRADQVLDRRISGDQPKDRAERVSDALADIVGAGADYLGAPRDRDPVLGPFGGAKGTPEAEAIIAQNLQDRKAATAGLPAAEAAALADKVAGTDKPAGGTKGTSKKSGIAAAKSKMDQDKWLALAQAGLTLMSTGDFGKAGSAGLAALRESGKADREERKLDAELMLREAQLAAANRKGTSGTALTANQLLSRGNDLIKSGQTMLENAGEDVDAAAEARTLIMAGQELIRRVTGGVASSGSTGAIKLPSAG